MSTSRKREIRCHRGRHRATRARTFSTEAKAKAYATQEGIKNYDVVKVNFGLSDKLKIVVK